MQDRIRSELKGYVDTIWENCKQFKHETEKTAYFMEDLYAYQELYDLSFDKGMDKRFKWSGEDYGLIEEDHRWINFASGAFPVDDTRKKELRLFEYARPKFKAVFNALRYCDEFWFFTVDTKAIGYVEYNYIGSNLPPKIDLTQIYAFGVTRLNWFDIVNPVNNPERKGVWSPFPFVELYHQWCFTYHVPVYVDGKFKGAMVPHLKIDYVLNDSVHKSKETMMLIHDDCTLMGMNAAARKEFKEVENYEYRPWDDHSKKINYVRHDLNLLNNKNPDIVRLVDATKWMREFEASVNGKKYIVMKESIPEIKCNLVACIDK